MRKKENDQKVTSPPPFALCPFSPNVSCQNVEIAILLKKVKNSNYYHLGVEKSSLAPWQGF